jgi:hypothetical protein
MEENGKERRSPDSSEQVTRDFLGLFMKNKGLGGDEDRDSYRFSVSKELASKLPGFDRPEMGIGSIEDRMVPATKKFI